MRRRSDPRTDELERSLGALATEIEYPETPDIAAVVAARLEKAPARLAGAPRPLSGRRVRPAFAIAVTTLLVLVAGTLVFWPTARRAVADWLGVSGIRIETGVGTPSPSPGAARLDLGRLISLPEAEELAGFDVLVPASLGPPDEIFFREPPEGGMVTLVYRSRAGLRSQIPDVGLLVSQFQGRLRPDLIKKVTFGTRVEGAEVGGLPAYWLSGDPHSVLFIDAAGRIAEDTARLAGNVLLWERGPVTFRLESELSLDAAVAIAESLR